MLKDISIVILCGGRGTRIRSSIGDYPKLLAPINDEPFLTYLLNWINISFENINYEIILATGYLHEIILEFCDKNKIKVKFAKESRPLGTLGAAFNASLLAESNNLLIMNGDTLIDFDLNEAFLSFKKVNRPILITKKSKQNSNYHLSYMKNGFKYLKYNKINSDLVSLGILFTKKILLQNSYTKTQKMNIITPMMDEHFIAYNDCDTLIIQEEREFIDIGTEKSFKKAQASIPKIFNFKNK